MKCMKPFISILLVIVLLAAGCNKEEEKTGNAAIDGELEISENQTLYIGQVTSIHGNEITIALAEEMDMSSMRGQRLGNQSSATGSSIQANESTNQGAISNSNENSTQQIPSNSEGTSNEEMPFTPDGDSSGEMPSRPDGDSSGEMPSRPDMDSSGEMPSRPDGDSSGEMPSRPDMDSSGEISGNLKDGNSENQESKRQSMVVYQRTGEEMTMMIPVGTPVTTLLGTTATFSRIATDNTIKIVTEKNENQEEVIVSVWIVG